MFRRPLQVRAISRTEEGVTTGVDLAWSSQGAGWVTSEIKLTVTNENNRKVLERNLDLQART